MHTVLNPLFYLRRNLSKTMPLMLVIAMSVVMVASVVTVVRSIDLTVYTIYGYNRFLTGLTPRNMLAVDENVVKKVRAIPQLGNLEGVHSYQVPMKTIFGRLTFPVFGLTGEGRKLLMERCEVRLSAGRMPTEGEPEAALSEEVARNIGAKIGDVIMKPDSEDSYAPLPIKLVGLLRGKVWMGLMSKVLVDFNSPFTWQGYLAFARTPGQQRELDEAMDKLVDKSKARVWKFAYLIKETRSSLSNLYLILTLIITIVVSTISFVCGLLTNIYFTQRLPEVATLSAIGYTRERLLWRAAKETILYCVLGWALGCLLTMTLLGSVRALLLEPRGLLLNAFDINAYVFTLPLPITIILFATATIGIRLSRLDPVSIIERRG